MASDFETKEFHLDVIEFLIQIQEEVIKKTTEQTEFTAEQVRGAFTVNDLIIALKIRLMEIS